MALAAPFLGAFVAQQADGTIVHTPYISTTINNAETVYIDLGDGLGGTGNGWFNDNTSSLIDLSFYYSYEDSTKPRVESLTGVLFVEDPGLSGFASNLQPGVLVDSSLSKGSSLQLAGLASGDLTPVGNFSPSTTGYIGFQYTPLDTELFGWIQVSYNSDRSLTVLDLAYEDSGAPIAVGAIPEPATNALIAAVLAGSAALYHRRQKKIQDCGSL